MGIDKNTYIVKISKSLTGTRLLAYRQPKGRYRPFDAYIPYTLAMYLNLVPEKNSARFTNRLYDFSNSDLDELKPCNIVTKISGKGNYRILTIDLSQV